MYSDPNRSVLRYSHHPNFLQIRVNPNWSICHIINIKLTVYMEIEDKRLYMGKNYSWLFFYIWRLWYLSCVCFKVAPPQKRHALLETILSVVMHGVDWGRSISVNFFCKYLLSWLTPGKEACSCLPGSLVQRLSLKENQQKETSFLLQYPKYSLSNAKLVHAEAEHQQKNEQESETCGV